MQLNINRFFSDRVVFDNLAPDKLRVTNSFWDWCLRVIAWFYSPSSYSEENRRTIACFKKYLIDTLGKERLQRICTRYSLDLDQMQERGSSLLSRDVAKIVIGARVVTVQDMIEHTKKFERLDRAAFAQLRKTLSHPFEVDWQVPGLKGRIGGRPTEWLARRVYDPFLTDRERLHVAQHHYRDSFEVFTHNMVARVIKREMDVGMLVPAPNHPNGQPQFYYVSAKIVTGEGMVSYILHPATKDTNLEPIRFFRGTAARSSEIDGISSVITDLEKDLGRTAFESGSPYEAIISEKIGLPPVEAGHSLGATLVQYRLANMDHIRKGYLYCGPGVPEGEAEKFNQKNPKVELIIRHTHNDKFTGLGQVHLGHKAPANVKVSYVKYHPPQVKRDRRSIHVMVWPKEKVHYGMQGGMSPEQRDLDFDNRNHHREKMRAAVGPIFAGILRALRNWNRSWFSSRAEQERGLRIGYFQKGHFKVGDYRTITLP